jgi:hypothetical protein
MQAELAEAWDAAGERTAAQQAAQRALELDRLNHQAGHRDKYLTEAQHARLTALVGSSKGPEEKREK